MSRSLSITFCILKHPPVFSGAGQSLSGKSNPAPSTTKGKEKEKSSDQNSTASWGSSGQTLGARSAGAGGASIPRPPHRNKEPKKERSPTPDWGVDDEDVIMIDSD